jgi:flagellar motor switch protein FliM
METGWVKADFSNANQWEGAAADQLRLVNEALARDLALNLAAFLRAPVTVNCTGATRNPFDEFLKDDDRSCFAAALTRPQGHKVALRADYDLLFPLIGIALGAKAGAFASPGRKPTEIELQVATLLFRLVLTEAFRAWTPFTKLQLEPLTVEVEPTPARILPGSEFISATELTISVAECTGKFVIAAPAGLFAGADPGQAPQSESTPEPVESPARILSLMMAAQVNLEIWLDSSDIRLGDLLQLQAGQIVRLEHSEQKRVLCTLNGDRGFAGQIVNTGSRRGFLVEEILK